MSVNCPFIYHNLYFLIVVHMMISKYDFEEFTFLLLQFIIIHFKFLYSLPLWERESGDLFPILSKTIIPIVIKLD